MKEYAVTIGGIRHTMLLDPDDAERRYGDKAVEVKAKSTQNKSRTAATKADPAADPAKADPATKAD